MLEAPESFTKATPAQKSAMFEWLRSEVLKPNGSFHAGLAAYEIARLMAPVPMLLFCPRCHAQHIDKPAPGWANPPHATHTCAFCGLLWRPSNHNTMGVGAIVAEEPRHVERIRAAYIVGAVPPEIPLCDGHAQTWFCERNHLTGDHDCVVCGFIGWKKGRSG